MDYSGSMLPAPIHTRVYVFYFDIQLHFQSNISNKDHLYFAFAKFISLHI